MREENVKTHKYTYVAVTNEQGKRERELGCRCAPC